MTELDLIDTQELKQKLDREDDFKLVMTLGEWEYRTKHIPGSLCISTVEEALETLHPHDEIVLYDSGPLCGDDAGRLEPDSRRKPHRCLPRSAPPGGSCNEWNALHEIPTHGEGTGKFLGFDRGLGFLAPEHRPQVLGGQGRHPVAGLDGGAADVRGENHVLELEQLWMDLRLLLVDVEPRGEDSSVFEGVGESGLVYYRPARGID